MVKGRLGEKHACSASISLALCGMRTLYLRNVPDDVMTRLEHLAQRQRISLNTLALHELTEASRRADNADLLSRLADLNIDTTELVADIDAGRDQK